MNCKSLFVLFAACAVSFSAAAQSGPSTLSLRGTPDLGLGAAPKTAGAGDAAAEAAIRRALLSQPASEEEVVKALSFMPDVVAEVNGTKITKKEIIDMLLSKKVSQQVLALTPESYLRTAMQQYVEQKIDTAILKQKAKEAGFVPSEELVKTHFDESIKKLPAEQVDAVKAQLKERGMSLEEYRDEIAKEADIQGNAAIAAYEEKNFIEKTEKTVNDAAVEKFYRENQQKFAVPESITVAHILIQCEPVSALDSKEEKEIKTKADKLAKEQIDEIYVALAKDPASFDKLAQEKSNCPSGKRDNGKLPPFDKEGMLLDQSGMLDPDFAAAAFKLAKPGEFTKPVHTQFGYHIIKLLKQDPKGYMPLDKVKGEIRDFLVDKTVSEEIQAMLKAERTKSNVKVYDFTPAKADPKATKNPGAAPTPVL
ncbi:MAG: peptidylprolyl isomerase [Lentisphaeria bacterium]|nr:peptidylprolyl isomerase [Lentisphaeria bacterium]